MNAGARGHVPWRAMLAADGLGLLEMVDSIRFI